MAIFRIRPGLRKSDPNPTSRRSLAVRCGARWRGRCKTSSCCLSRRCSAITARTPPGPHSVAVMKRIGNSRRTAPQMPTAPGERRIVGVGEVEAHHPEQGVQEPFGLAQREMVDESQGQGGLDGEIRVPPLPTPPAAPAGRPGSGRLRGQPHRHIAAPNESLIVGSPVRNAILRLIRGMDLRLHPCSVAPAEGHEKCGPNRPTPTGYSCNNALIVGRPVRHAILCLIPGMNLRLHPRSVAPAEGPEKCGPRRPTRSGYSCNNADVRRHATVPNLGVSERIGNSRRTGLVPVANYRGMAQTFDRAGQDVDRPE